MELRTTFALAQKRPQPRTHASRRESPEGLSILPCLRGEISASSVGASYFCESSKSPADPNPPQLPGERTTSELGGSISILRCSLDARSWSSNRPPFLPVLQMPMGREGNKQVWTKHHISNSPLEVAGATPVSQLPNEEKWARKALSEHYSIAPHSLEGLWIMRHDGLGIGDNFFGTVSMVCLAPLRSNHT